jgi:hypothetical protein
MNKLPLLCLACAALLTLPGCASNPSRPPPTLDQRLAAMGWKQGPEVDEIRRYTIDGWNPIDDTHLVMDAGPSRAYLITLRFSCINLDFVEGLHFTTTPPAAVTHLDEMIVPQPGGGVPQRCPIDTIRKLALLQQAPGR